MLGFFNKVACIGCLIFVCGVVDPVLLCGEEPWRSTMYPEDWQPGYADAHGRFVHDFSYAGYHFGEKAIPDKPPGRVVPVTHRVFGADPTGVRDSTAAIQKALDRAGEAGGGVVYLPEGTYRVNSPEAEGLDQVPGNQALLIRHSGVVLRGAGSEKTRIFNDNYKMRGQSVIRVASEGRGVSWTNEPGEGSIPFAADADNQTKVIQLESLAGVAPGDWLVLRIDCTDEFIQDVAPRKLGPWSGRLPGISFYRQVVEVDRRSRRILIDIPLRFQMLLRDNARIYPIAPHLTEVGIESLSIGMREHPGNNGWGFNDYRNEGNSAYDVHGSYAIHINHVVHGWVRDVRSYLPEGNESRYHMLSNGINLNNCRNVTVIGCDLRNARYRGGGGNGYGYVIRGSDNLITRSRGEGLRYVFDFGLMHCTGNVVHRSESRGTSDFHMHFSVGNLLDNIHLTAGNITMSARDGAGTISHGQTTMDSVCWNIIGEAGRGEAVHVGGQSGDVHIVGTRGRPDGVRGLKGEHAAWFEGRGKGETLVPESLYEDQLRRRLQR